MIASRKALGVFSALLMVLGALIFVVSFSTMAWSVGYSGEMQGVWRECTIQNGTECGQVKPTGWVRAVQWSETLALVVMLGGLLVMTFRLYHATARYILLQMVANIITGVLVLIGVVVHRSATSLPSPGYSFYLAAFAFFSFLAAGSLNFMEYRHVHNELAGDSPWGRRLVDTMNVHI